MNWKINPASYRKRIKTIRYFAIVLVAILILLLISQCVQQRQAGSLPFERFMQSMQAPEATSVYSGDTNSGDTNTGTSDSLRDFSEAAENNTIRYADPLNLSDGINGVITFVEASDGGNILYYDCALDASQAAEQLTRALCAAGWLPIDNQQTGLLSFTWSDDKSGTVFLLAYLQDVGDGSTLVVQLP